MQLIAVDIGNSFTKIAVEADADLQSANQSDSADRWSSNIRLHTQIPIVPDQGDLKLPQQPAFWAVSSVNSPVAIELGNWVKKNRPDDQFHLIKESEVKLDTDVASREQLGRDRLIAAWMAVVQNANAGPLIVVDAGTAVTIDYVDKHLVFQGGQIFPGAQSCFEQLTKNTDALPELSQDGRSEMLDNLIPGTVGKSTDQAILNGVYQSQIAAVAGIVESMSKKMASEPTVYLTGGGADEISKLLPQTWHRVPDLVLRGACEIGRRLI